MSQQSGNEWGQGEQNSPDGHGSASESGPASGEEQAEHAEQWEHREQAQGPESTSSASSFQQDAPQQGSYQQDYSQPDQSGSTQEQYGGSEQYGSQQYGQASADPYSQGSASSYGQPSANPYGQPSANPQGDWNANQQGGWDANQQGGVYPPPQGGMPNQGYPPQGMQMAGAPVAQSDEKMWGWLVHVLMILTGFLGPLIVYVIYKDRSKWILDNAKESLNFGILSTIVMFVGGILTVVGVGVIILVVWPLLVLIFGILAAMAANNGKFYKYPLNLRLVS